MVISKNNMRNVSVIVDDQIMKEYNMSHTSDQ